MKKFLAIWLVYQLIASGWFIAETGYQIDKGTLSLEYCKTQKHFPAKVYFILATLPIVPILTQGVEEQIDNYCDILK